MIRSATLLAAAVFSHAAQADTSEIITAKPVINHAPEISDAVLVAQVPFAPAVDMYHPPAETKSNDTSNTPKPREEMRSYSVEPIQPEIPLVDVTLPTIYGQWEFSSRRHDYHVVELSPYNDPDMLCVAVEGKGDTAVDCFVRGDDNILPEGYVLQSYETEFNRFHEIRPGSDKTKTCLIAVGKWGGLDMDCR